ncbi:hypothetical protein [Actinomadura sp. B10D3]|uniref:hypothetical protein n=1 Tax=Actinomadura sp. B10D3 TaxID=3153557 RepID=UPI00325F0B03
MESADPARRRAMMSDRERLRFLAASNVRYKPLEAILRRLAPVPADPLVGLILDPHEFRYRRALCARALLGRVPPEHAAALAECGRDATVDFEVRNPVLMSVLSMPGTREADDLLSWLRTCEIDAEERASDSLSPAISLARAMDGDASAVEALAERATDPWWTERTEAEQAIEALIRARGHAAVLSAFGRDSTEALARHGRSPAERLLGLRCHRRAGGDITFCLGDDSALVARKAYDLLIESRGADEELLVTVRENRPGHVWALAVLHKRGHDIRPLWEEAGSPRIELPGVPSDVREAIVRHYAPGQRDTDPRWLVEAALLGPSLPSEDRDDLIEKRLDFAFRALRAWGLKPQKPLSAHQDYGQGSSTYHVISTDAGKVYLSTLGPFFMLRDEHEEVKALLQMSGFRHIGKELGATVFTGLAVYYFGIRDPLRIRNLLFYWQD